MATIIDKNGNIAFFGRVSWGNFVDWLVTLCLGAIFILTTISLGGVRPDTHLVLLPLYGVLLFLHGLWLAVDRESPKRLSQHPLWFVPALLWMLASVLWFSPVPWRGWYEIIYALEAFVMLWVLSNNVRTRAHLWLLILMSLIPGTIAVFNGFYQFFQRPDRIMGAMTDYGLEINEVFLGRATGVFADPNSLAVFLLSLLPLLLVVAAVRRLPKILRLLSLYIALMFIAGLAFTQLLWAVVLTIVVLAVVPWFCFRTVKRRLLYSAIGLFTSSLIFTLLLLYHPVFKQELEQAVSGEGVRLVLWQEAMTFASESPITGVGAGGFSAAFEQSPRVALAEAPLTPHNDYLLVLSQLGFVGLFLWGLPCIYVFFRAFGRWRKEPFAVKLRGAEGTVMPPQRFFLSIGLSVSMAFALCMAASFVFYVPALTLYGVLAFAILLKTTFNRRLILPGHWVHRIGYLLLAACAGWAFYVLGSLKLEAQALELRARQQLEHVVDMRVHVSGNKILLDEVIELYEDAVIADAENVDAWIGLSAAVCQLYFRNPSDFERIAERAVECAQRGVDLSPDYWKSWAQLGVARAFHGEQELAEYALVKALELAPHNSNAHYYYAAYLSSVSHRRDEALSMVRQALEINPNNAAARRLQQKLLIL
ncbi:O-antigen ligase family protein [Coraliomargarita sp. SDUM461003]|uniref:O-antigen ligase family protein n=1 Tax=Thalassobacterium maritimum TaxID=3041265 RepID=A0ABU1ATW0_9BACT|nr:O-antigen ligase family protein [Coraliomargarita sp. SDUM461003]MDQ8206555.1 O-antigen ligase family protein [Coraliomargarita sp. SDUM461003]